MAYVTSVGTAARESTSFDPRGAGRKELWVSNVATGALQRIGDRVADDWAPVWSPNSSTLAFYSGRGGVGHLSFWTRATGARVSTQVPVSSGSAHPVEWFADNRRVLVPALTRASVAVLSKTNDAFPKPTPTPPIAVFRSTPAPRSAAAAGNVITVGAASYEPAVNETVYNLASGRTRVLIRDLRMIAKPLLSPDGRQVAYVVDRGEIDSDINDREIYDVFVINTVSGKAALVAHNILTNYTAETLSWSHDGAKLGFVGGRLPGDASVTTSDSGAAFPGHLYVIDLSQPLRLQETGSGLYSRFAGRLFWSADDSTIYAVDGPMRGIAAITVSTGESRIAIRLEHATFDYSDEVLRAFGSRVYTETVSDNGERQIARVSLATGSERILFHAYENIGSLTYSADGRRTAFIGENARQPADVWVAQNEFAHERQLTHLNPLIESRALGDVVGISWKSNSGVALRGALLLPAHYESAKRYPMITWIYGGEPEGTQDRVYFGLDPSGQAPYFNLQLLASRGYAVFVPNSVLHVGTPMADLADDVLPGLDKIVQMGVADSNRLGLYGQSYGGYSTMALLVQSDRFKAAVAMSGIYDIVSMYGTMYDDGTDWTSWAESEQGRMGGTPWTQRARYIENSPFFTLDRVHTPVLLEYGTTDTFAAINAGEAFVGLRRLGKTVELVRYANEGHVLMKRSNQIDLCNRIFAWFGRYLR